MSEPDVYDMLSPVSEGESSPRRSIFAKLIPQHHILGGAITTKSYNVLYKVRTLQEIMDMRYKEIKKIETVLEVHVS